MKDLTSIHIREKLNIAPVVAQNIAPGYTICARFSDPTNYLTRLFLSEYETIRDLSDSFPK
jgi:hypothetical protein